MPKPNDALLLTEAPPLASFTALAELSRICFCLRDDDENDEDLEYAAPNTILVDDDAVTASLPMLRKEVGFLLLPMLGVRVDVVAVVVVVVGLFTLLLPGENHDSPLVPFPLTSGGTTPPSSPSAQAARDPFCAPGSAGTFPPGCTRVVAVDIPGDCLRCAPRVSSCIKRAFKHNS